VEEGHFYSAGTYLFRALALLLSAARVQVLSPTVVHVRWMLDVGCPCSCRSASFSSYSRSFLRISSRTARSAASSAVAAAFSECRHATIVMQADILHVDVHVLSDEQDSEEEHKTLADCFWRSGWRPSISDYAAIRSENWHTLLDLSFHPMWY